MSSVYFSASSNPGNCVILTKCYWEKLFFVSKRNQQKKALSYRAIIIIIVITILKGNMWKSYQRLSAVYSTQNTNNSSTLCLLSHFVCAVLQWLNVEMKSVPEILIKTSICLLK